LLHLYAENWTEGVESYFAAGGRADAKSVDFMPKMCGSGMALPLMIVGGQTFLHVIAQRRESHEAAVTPEQFAALCATFPDANTPDLNENLPMSYFARRDWPTAKRSSAEREDYTAAAARMRNSLTSRQYIDVGANIKPAADVVFDESTSALLSSHVRFFSVDGDLCRSISRKAATLPNKAPNSMHKYGKMLLPALQEEVYALIQATLPQESIDSITHIHAFDITYISRMEGGSGSVPGSGSEPGPVMTKLGLHVDDSTWTINACISETAFSGSDLLFTGLKHPEGKERVFPPYSYRHAPFRGVVHRGFLQHSVNDLTSGSRESIIIWVTCDRTGAESVACSDGAADGAGDDSI
jgi:hypothetical protein